MPTIEQLLTLLSAFNASMRYRGLYGARLVFYSDSSGHLEELVLGEWRTVFSFESLTQCKEEFEKHL